MGGVGFECRGLFLQGRKGKERNGHGVWGLSKSREECGEGNEGV